MTGSPLVQVEVQVDGIAAGGEGVGRLPDGRAVFVHRTAPGDLAQINLTRQKPRWARGTLARIESPGPEREKPTCDLYDRCGGCTLQHMSYAAQLEWKARIVRQALKRIGGLDVPVSATAPSLRQIEYRTRMTYTLRRLRGGRVVAGLHEIESKHRILDVRGECKLPSPELAQAWLGLRAAWGPGAGRLPSGSEIRLSLRSCDEGVMLLIGGGKGPCDSEALVNEVDDLVSVWRSPAQGPAQWLAGARVVHDTWMGVAVPVSGSAFNQVNREVGHALHERVLELAADVPGTVVDAYAGIGILARILASGGRSSVAIELDPDAVRASKHDTPGEMRVLEGRVEHRLAEALPADLVILNPPRTGLHADVPRALCGRPAQGLIYVSCDPATLARDLVRLSDAYDVVSVETFDLFPQTAHVETLVRLEQKTTP